MMQWWVDYLDGLAASRGGSMRKQRGPTLKSPAPSKSKDR
jgi:hypothetical protein